VAGDEMNEDIINYARQKYNLLIGERMAERAKIEIGSAYPMERERTMILRGRNLITGLPDRGHVTEARHVCVDTTASGGNAALLAEAGNA
jgi:rod shape-determining protein MreB